MEDQQIRRERLKEWFENNPIPEKEKSYISQLINGKASFGEKAARRLEKTYKMPPKHLDQIGERSEAHKEEVVFYGSDIEEALKKSLTYLPVHAAAGAGSAKENEELARPKISYCCPSPVCTAYGQRSVN